MIAILNNLNDIQQNIVTSSAQHILAISGAGSGKTRVLTHKIAYDISQGVNAGNVLALTFTNKAANEINERLQVLLASQIGVRAGTFHSICNWLIRPYYKYFGFERPFVIIDEDDKLKIIRKLLVDVGVDESIDIKTLISGISKFKTSLKSPQAELAKLEPNCYQAQLIHLTIAYNSYLKNFCYCDFDDLLIYAVELLSTNQAVQANFNRDYCHIYVDEFQDVNWLQYQFIKLLIPNTQHMFAVGDDCQSIYGFNGADLAIIQDYITEYQPAQFKMEQNYRSTGHILNVANSLLTNTNHIRKQLWTTKPDGTKPLLTECREPWDEAMSIVHTINRLRLDGHQPREMAILSRTQYHTVRIQQALLKYKIPYYVYGIAGFADRAEVKDTVAYLRLSVNPKDDLAFERIVNVPKRGIGKATIEKFRVAANTRGCGVYEVLCDNTYMSNFSSKIQQAAQDLVGVIETTKSHMSAGLTVLSIIEYIWLATQYLEYVDTKLQKKLIKSSAIGDFKIYATDFGNDMDAFMTSLALLLQPKEPTHNNVTVMTIHAAKGLEFPVVFLPCLEDGILPHYQCSSPDEISEERRLLYVGITRAQKLLFMSYCNSRYDNRNRLIRAKPSRFLGEIDSAYFDIKANRTNVV